MSKNKKRTNLSIVGNSPSVSSRPVIILRDGKVTYTRKLHNNLNDEEYQTFLALYIDYFEKIITESKNRKLNLADAFSKILQDKLEADTEKNKITAADDPVEQEFEYGSFGGWLLSGIVLPGLFILACYLFLLN